MTALPSILSGIHQNIIEANATYQLMTVAHSNLINNASSISQTLSDIAMDTMITDFSAVQLNETAADVETNLEQRKVYLDQISFNQTGLDSELNTAELSLSDLRVQLLEAQKAAASVSTLQIFPRVLFLNRLILP